MDDEENDLGWTLYTWIDIEGAPPRLALYNDGVLASDERESLASGLAKFVEMARGRGE